MNTEIEAKFLNVDPAAMRAKLKSAGAQLLHPERLMRRRTFDYPDKRLAAAGGWVRVRDEIDQVTLSYKELKDWSLHGTKEVVVQVGSFDSMVIFLEAIGLVEKAYQETRRETWLLDGAEITIDSWPWIPPFVEIEGPSESAVRSAAASLNLDWSDALHGSVETAYQDVYDVTGPEVNTWRVISFTAVPDWLEQKRKKSVSR